MPVPACVLALAGAKASLEAVPTVTLRLAVPLVRPEDAAVIVALPREVGVKLALDTPLVGATGVAGLHDPVTPAAEKLTAFVAVVTVLPN
jgi:hypothetical protein